jgi:hypothetical protein
MYKDEIYCGMILTSSVDGIGRMACRGSEQNTDVGHPQIRDRSDPKFRQSPDDRSLTS